MVGGEKRMVGTAPVILDGLKGCVQVKYRSRTKLYHLGQKKINYIFHRNFFQKVMWEMMLKI